MQEEDEELRRMVEDLSQKVCAGHVCAALTRQLLQERVRLLLHLLLRRVCLDNQQIKRLLHSQVAGCSVVKKDKLLLQTCSEEHNQLAANQHQEAYLEPNRNQSPLNLHLKRKLKRMRPHLNLALEA